MPVISIVVPIYNSEERLSQCLNSILAQSYKDFELILVNDGSTDSSAEICESIMKKNKRVSLYNRENSGVSASRNFGMSVAQGEFVMFCDSDDEVEPDWCLELLNSINKYPDMSVICGINKKRGTKSVKTIHSDEIEYEILTKDEYYSVHKLGIAGSPCNKIFSLSKLKNNSIKFNEEISLAEDVVFCIDYLNVCEGFCFVNKALYNYKLSENDSSLTTKYTRDLFQFEKICYDNRRGLISDKYKQQFYNEYYIKFNNCLSNTFDKRNTGSLLEKLKYNNSVINDPSFIECLHNCSITEDEIKYAKLLETKNYYLVYMSGIIHRLIH